MNRSRETRSRAAKQRAFSLLGALGVIAVAVGGATPVANAGAVWAHTARTLDGTATARLHLVKPEGSQLIEEGPVSGVLSGSARGDFYTGAQFTGTVTIRTRAGSVSGRGRATPHGSGRYQSFSGSLTLTGGTGRYTHAHGEVALYGTFDRRSDSVIVQTVGSFSY
jgi:hypothetical protein